MKDAKTFDDKYKSLNMRLGQSLRENNVQQR